MSRLFVKAFPMSKTLLQGVVRGTDSPTALDANAPDQSPASNAGPSARSTVTCLRWASNRTLRGTL